MRGAIIGLLLGVALVWLPGCARQEAARVSASGVSFALPAGWQEKEPGSELFTHPSDSETWVMVMSTPLEGKTLSAHVDQVAGEQQTLDRTTEGLLGMAGEMVGDEAPAPPPAGTTVIARRVRTVSGQQGIELVLEAEARVMTLFLQRGDQAVEINCRSPKESFARHEAVFRQVLDSVRVE